MNFQTITIIINIIIMFKGCTGNNNPNEIVQFIKEMNPTMVIAYILRSFLYNIETTYIEYSR